MSGCFTYLASIRGLQTRPRAIGEKRDIQPIADARPPLLPEREKKGIRDAHASKGYGRKAGKTKAKGEPQRYRQSCPGGSSSFPIERAASQHAPPKQMRAPAISISTSHKMISLWGKLSTNSNRTKRQASPIFRMARPNSLPGLPLSPAPIQAPKAMMANAPKKMPKKLSTRTSR